MRVMASEITGNSTVGSIVVYANNKESSSTLVTFFVREIYQWQICSFQNVCVVNIAVHRSVEQTVFLQPVTTVIPHERNDASNHQQLDCLFNGLLTTKKAQLSTLLVPCEGWPEDSPHKGPVTHKKRYQVMMSSWTGEISWERCIVNPLRHIGVENSGVFALDNGVVLNPRKYVSMAKRCRIINDSAW